jgi:hypothetical protein
MAAGAKAALHGYRIQAVYSVSRILRTSDALTFRPEGNEDLEVLDSAGRVLESIQVKARADNLTLSDLDPEKPDSFFRRAIRTIAAQPLAAIKIVSFGPIGPELQRAFSRDGAERRAVAQKLKEHGYTAQEASLLLGRVTLASEDEASTTASVVDALRAGIMGGDSHHALDLLTYWIFRQAEAGGAITRASLQQKVQSVGRYLAERAAHHAEWFTSIVPVDERPVDSGEPTKLANEFLSGVAARYEHILAGLDVARVAPLERIEQAFKTHRVLIVHGASGQGKSTLAYRYLHDYVPDGWRFQVLAVADRRHALSIARALAGHLSQFDAPTYVYIDVSFRDRDWPALVRALAQQPLVRVLVTVREEDWRRASISGADVPFDDFELALDKTEAEALFANLRDRLNAANFLTFEDAWMKFGGGPLMEFVHLVAQSTTLTARLRQQIWKLSDDARAYGIGREELDLLRMVSVASAYEARIDLPRLVDSLRLPEPIRTITLFEKEYLLRCSPDGAHITGLHPVRSSIIVDIMTDPALQPWHAVACRSIEVMVEEDLEAFLLYAFKRQREEGSKLRSWLRGWRPRTWTGLAGVWRTLLWSGLEAYVEENIGLIEEIRAEVAHAWSMVIDFDIAGALPSDWLESSKLFPPAALEKIRGYRARQTPKRRAYQDAIQWLAETSRSPVPPTSDADWVGLGELLFWSAHLGIRWTLMAELEALLTDQLAESLPLEPLAAFLTGYAIAFPPTLYSWLSRNRPRLAERFRRETNTVKLEDDGEKICTHFIVDRLGDDTPLTERKRPEGGLNGEVMWRVEMMRWLFPDRKHYAGQGYGHQLGHWAMPSDDTTKNIEADNFHPDFLVRVNAIFRNLVNWRFRPDDWAGYVTQVMTTRSQFVCGIEELTRFIDDYLAGRINDIAEPPQPHGIHSDGRWRPLYPKCVVDEWGFVSEDMPSGAANENRIEALLLRKYASYSEAIKNAFGSAGNFAGQIHQALRLNIHVGRATSPEIVKKIRDTGARLGIDKMPRLAFHNFARAWRAWSTFQAEFARRFILLCDPAHLKALDDRERESMKAFWALLYFMIHQPSCRFIRPLKEATCAVSNDHAKIEASLRRRLRQISEASVTASVLDVQTGVDGEPALWLTYDTTSPVARKRGLGAVLEVVRQELGVPDESSLRWNITITRWRRIYVVHLVRGKALCPEAWKFDASSLSMTPSNQLEWYNLAPIALAPDILAVLEFGIWDDQHLSLALELFHAVFELWALVAMLHGSMAVTEKDDLGTEILQRHLDRHSGKLSAAYSHAQESLRAMGEHFASLGEQVDQCHNLRTAREALIVVNDRVRPRDGVDGEVYISEADFGIWEKRLEEAKEVATVAQFYWMADVIKKISKSRGSSKR